MARPRTRRERVRRLYALGLLGHTLTPDWRVAAAARGYLRWFADRYYGPDPDAPTADEGAPDPMDQ